MSIAGSAGAPTGFTAFLARRATGPRRDTGAAPVPLGYVVFQPSAAMSFATYPSFSITLPSSVSTSGQTFYIAFSTTDPGYSSLLTNGWFAPALGPANVSLQVLSFTGGTATPPFSLSPSYKYVFCLYQVAASPTSSPSSSTSPSTSPSSSASPSASPSSSHATTYTFGGSTATLTVTAGQTPAQVSLSAYQGLTMTAQFVAPTSGGGQMVFSDATNNGDVSPNTLPADTAGGSGYTGVFYLSVVNNSANDISFGNSFPKFVITDSAFPAGATTCSFDSYSNNGGSSPAWSARARPARFRARA